MTKDQAISHFGDIKGLCEALDISPAAVSQWGKYPPQNRQYELEILTKGKLKADRKKGAR